MFTAYVVVTLMAVAASAFVAVANFMRLGFVLTTAARVKVPESWITVLGTLNAAAALDMPQHLRDALMEGKHADAWDYVSSEGTARTAVVMIDMQRDFLEPGGFGAMLGNDVGMVEVQTEDPEKVGEILAPLACVDAHVMGRAFSPQDLSR